MRNIQVRSLNSEPIKAFSLLTINNRGFVIEGIESTKFSIGIAGEDLHSEHIELADNGTWVNIVEDV